jgi:hypothetical protein
VQFGIKAIGSISRIQGEASATKSGSTRALALDAPVFLDEAVTTSRAARLEITFKDNTRVTLGATAQLTLDRYIFNPALGRGAMKIAIVGVFRFLSGQLSKLTRSDVSVMAKSTTQSSPEFEIAASCASTGEIFYTLREAKVVIESWRRHYNAIRPPHPSATNHLHRRCSCPHGDPSSHSKHFSRCMSTGWSDCVWRGKASPK